MVSILVIALMIMLMMDYRSMTIQSSDNLGTALAENAGEIVRDCDDTATYA